MKRRKKSAGQRPSLISALEDGAKELIGLVSEDIERSGATSFSFSGTFKNPKTGKAFCVDFKVSTI